jgi:thioredoxin 1
MKEVGMKVWLGFLIGLFVMAGMVSCSHKTKEADLEGRISAANSEGRVVMLELGSEGCIACEKMKPVMKKLRQQFSDKLEVIFVDVRKDNAASRKYGIMLIPTQVFLDKSGKEFYRHVGYFSYEEIVGMLKKRKIL